MATVIPNNPNAPGPQHTLRTRLQIFAEDIALPTATTEETLNPVVMADKTQTSLEIVVQARSESVKVADGSEVSFKRASTDTETRPYSKVALKLNAGDYAAGDVIGVLPLPSDAPAFVQATWKGAAGNTGSVDLVLSYIPR